MSADPLELHTVGKTDANLYAYVEGKALKAVDPLGLFGLEVHFEISRKAINKSNKFNSINTFRVESAHKSQDSVTWGQFHSAHHFDNSNFKNGLKLIDRDLKQYSAAKGMDNRSMALGRALHAIQDFYAHSNFIDLYNAYDPKAKRAPTFEEVFDKKNANYQKNAAFRKFLGDKQIVTGGFSMLDPRTWKSWVPGARGHGALNKDSGSSDPVKQLKHDMARDAAERASIAAIRTGQAFTGRDAAPLADGVSYDANNPAHNPNMTPKPARDPSNPDIKK